MDYPIVGFIENSLVDWDGKVVAVVFTQGCNFKCPFCFNYKLFKNLGKQNRIDLNYIKEKLLKSKGFIDGVCITGGEPTLHKDALLSFIEKIKNTGFGVKLDTNGTNPDALKKLIDNKLIDYIAMDIKAPLKFEKYSKVCGVKKKKLFDNVKKSIDLIKNSGIDYEFRTTVVPTLLSKKDIVEIAKYLGNVKKYVLQQFRPKDAFDPKLRKVEPYSKDELKEMMEGAKKYTPNMKIRSE